MNVAVILPESPMEILRWILAGTALSLYTVMMTALLMMAIRRIRTGQYASGLAFVPSLLALAGILVLPVSTLGTRALYVPIPFAIESLYFWFNVVHDIRKK